MPLVLDFLTQIRNFIRSQNGDELRAWLQVEPNSPQQYHNLAAELRSQFRQQGLDNVIEKSLPQEDDVPEGQATVWPGFVAFMKDYMAFWRDVNYDDLLGAHQLLSGLVKYEPIPSHKEPSLMAAAHVLRLLLILHMEPCFLRRACPCRKLLPVSQCLSTDSPS